MRFAFLLAFRYFRAPRVNLLTRLTAFAAVAGIACGTAAMIVAIALANGFREAMQEKILANTAHVTIFRVDGAEITDWQELNEQIKQIEGVKKISAQSFDNALLIGKTSSAFAVLRGSLEKSQTEEIKGKFVIEIGKVLAEKTGLKAGDTTEILSGSGQLNESFVPISTSVEIGAVFETGLYEYDSTWIQLSLENAAKLTGKPFPIPSTIAIQTVDVYKSNELARKISESVGAEYKVLDWQEANRPLFAALALERRIAFLIIFLIIFVAALNITTTLMLSVSERRFDISVLRALGAGGRVIIAIFLIEGLILALIGLIAGMLLAIFVCFFNNYFHLISLPPDVYEIGNITLRLNAAEVFLIAIIILILCLAASLVPARIAAKMRPHENLKN